MIMECDTSNYTVMDDGAKRAKLEASETDRLPNFTASADEFELNLKRQKLPRDLMSHRIIEKRRRDRMNNCLADLSGLIPSSYHKQGQGRIEKTEIIELAIEHINLLQQRVNESESACARKSGLNDSRHEKLTPQPPPPKQQFCCATTFYMGFKEAQDEVMRFLVEVESGSAVDPFCKKIMKHLENASKKFITDRVPHHEPSDELEKPDLQSIEEDCANQTLYMPQSALYHSALDAAAKQWDKRLDKHLRSLLTEKQKLLNISETGMNGLVPMFSYSNELTNTYRDPNGTGSSGYVSDLSNIEKNSPSGSTFSRDNMYKFKHNITKRFSQEGHSLHHHRHHHHHSAQPSDTSSSTSSRDLEDDQSKIKWKGGKHKVRLGGSGPPSSDALYRDRADMGGASNGLISDECNSASTSGDSMRWRNSGKTNRFQVLSSSHHRENLPSGNSFVLPGFILHPSGTHYMPISVQNTNIPGLGDSYIGHDGPPVFHPISIPVHFRQPPM